jgi:hypothetical protein
MPEARRKFDAEFRQAAVALYVGVNAGRPCYDSPFNHCGWGRSQTDGAYPNRCQGDGHALIVVNVAADEPPVTHVWGH